MKHNSTHSRKLKQYSYVGYYVRYDISNTAALLVCPYHTYTAASTTSRTNVLVAYVHTYVHSVSSTAAAVLRAFRLVQHYYLLVYTRTAAAIQHTGLPLLVRKSAVTLLWYTAASKHPLRVRPSKQKCYRVTADTRTYILISTSAVIAGHNSKHALRLLVVCVYTASSTSVEIQHLFCFVQHYFLLVYVSYYSSTAHQHYDSYVHQQQHIHTT